VLEPLTIERTLLITYVLAAPGDTASPSPRMSEEARLRGVELVDAGAAEDRAVTCAIQSGLASDANEFREFGRFEGAIAHFHRGLHAAIDGTPWRHA
jgi:hypothetical protein